MAREIMTVKIIPMEMPRYVRMKARSTGIPHSHGLFSMTRSQNSATMIMPHRVKMIPAIMYIVMIAVPQRLSTQPRAIRLDAVPLPA